MRAIFNSLGSNYTWLDAWRALTLSNSDRHSHSLVELLEERYDGKAQLFYKGREAIQAALVAADLPQGSRVAITGFTCYAVYRAVIDAGHVPILLDVVSGTLNFDAQELQNSDARAVIIQNTLAVAVDIDSITAVAKKKQLVVIEDLAHCVGAVYPNGSEVGTVGDYTTLSFSQDKMVDGVTGGALVSRTKPEPADLPMVRVPTALQLRDRLYPLLTTSIRATYKIGIGKVLHATLKTLGLLSPPVDGVFGTYRSLPGWNAAMILRSFATLPANLDHRRELTEIYRQVFPSSLVPAAAASLRYPLLVLDQKSIIAQATASHLHITDIWYDAPIAPIRYLSKTNYTKGQCPNAEALCERLINLPTHRGVTPAAARELAERIQSWLN